MITLNKTNCDCAWKHYIQLSFQWKNYTGVFFIALCVNVCLCQLETWGSKEYNNLLVKMLRP